MKKVCSSCFAVFFAFMISVFGFSVKAYADTENVNAEKPSITAVYYDEQGKRADGNVLSAGHYRMELVLKGFATVSEMEFTANYSDCVSIDRNSYQCNIAASYEDIASLCKVGDGSIIICIVSLNDNCSYIASNGTVLFSADITVSSDGLLDMENVITENESPDYTFVEKDYGDINKDAVPFVYNCYGFGLNLPADYTGEVTDMRFDMSPELPLSYMVTGKIVAMIDPNNPNSILNANPVSDVDILVNGVVVSSTDESGNYSILLPDGSNKVEFDYQYGPKRSVTIYVNGADVDAGSITIVTADLNDDGSITYVDTGIYQDALTNADLMDDINKDGSVSYVDTGIYQAFLLKGLNNIYPEVIINKS